MSELVKCPFCKKPLETKLIADFWFCKDCKVAVRNENDMPMQNMNIYNEGWVKSQEESRYILKKSRYLLAKIKELHRVRRILDVGCGTGILVDILSRSGYTATGIDSSPDAIGFAKKNKQGNFELVSVESFQSEEKFDLIVATQIIEHLRNPEAFLLKIKNFLKPMGYLLLETPNLTSWNEKSLWRRRIGGMFHGTDHRICYTAKSLTRLLYDNGFNIYKPITKTYSPTIFVELIKTLLSPFRNKPAASLYANSSSVTCNYRSFKNICKAPYARFKDSLILDGLLFVSNRISEIKDRGNQLIVIARKREQT